MKSCNRHLTSRIHRCTLLFAFSWSEGVGCGLSKIFLSTIFLGMSGVLQGLSMASSSRLLLHTPCSTSVPWEGQILTLATAAAMWVHTAKDEAIFEVITYYVHHFASANPKILSKECLTCIRGRYHFSHPLKSYWLQVKCMLLANENGPALAFLRLILRWRNAVGLKRVVYVLRYRNRSFLAAQVYLLSMRFLESWCSWSRKVAWSVAWVETRVRSELCYRWLWLGWDGRRQSVWVPDFLLVCFFTKFPVL